MELRKATCEDIEMLMDIRLEMLRVVNNMSPDEAFSDELVDRSRRYFLEGDQTTVLAIDNGRAVGCASISYFRIMPTYSHPTGKRGHLMNVYTNSAYRRQGIAREMVGMLIEEAKARRVTEISLDATESGRPLYESLGFTASEEGMAINIGRNNND